MYDVVYICNTYASYEAYWHRHLAKEVRLLVYYTHGEAPKVEKVFATPPYEDSLFFGKGFVPQLKCCLRLLTLILFNTPKLVVFRSLNSFAERFGLFLAVISGTPFALHIVDWQGDFEFRLRHRSFLTAHLRRILLRFVGRLAKRMLVMGTQGARYWRSNGINARKIVIIPHLVDREFWQEQANSLLPKRSHLRKSIGIEGKICFLCVANYRPVKFLEGLYQAVETLPEHIKERILVLRVGYGGPPPPEGVVRDVGLLTQRELAKYYAASDCLIVPSYFEQWCLVINEAMFFGLPVITTSGVAAAADLLEDGINGFIVEPHSPQALGKAIQRFCALPDKQRHAMRKHSKKKILEWNAPYAIVGRFMKRVLWSR